MTRNSKNGPPEQRFALALGAIILVCASMPAAAQTLDGPEGACVGAPLRVEWTGPNAAEDAITVAQVDAPAERIIDATWTADGNPARLHAPISPGTYELRYVQGDPRNILVKERLDVVRCDEAWPEGWREEWIPLAAVFHGTQIHYGDEIDTSESTQYGPAGLSIEQFCQATEPFGFALGAIVDEIELQMYSAGAPFTLDSAAAIGAPTRASVERSMRNAKEEICDNPPPGTTTQTFVTTYAFCRMSMRTPTHLMDIHLPPGGGAGTMSIVDTVAEEAMTMSLRSSVDEVSEVIGKGWDEGLSMSGPAAFATRIGYPVGEYNFKYEMGLGGSDSPMALFGQTIKVKNEGTAWISSDVPGIDIVRSFYERLTTEMSPGGDSMSFFGGLISNIVAMLQFGIPLEMDQTTSSKALGAIGVKGRSQQYITAVELIDFEPGWCDLSLIPADYEVTDVDAQLAEAMGGTNSDEMSEAMQQYNDAMAQMTPEQRAMMESMGMGDMMGQAMGGAAAAGGSTAGGSTTSAACNELSSRELTTDDLLQTVQKHLHALGYDVGNTAGDESFMTTIAISQFQAEKGIEVTGEVTPQLIGILSAEVDSQC